jgi:AmmeMemoRadiSam system protein B
MTIGQTTSSKRPAAVAGRFYPESADVLAAQVDDFLAAVELPSPAKVRAIIVPHAGYPCSGQVAAHAFRALQALPERDRLIYLMGPAHWLPVSGIALSTAASFITPLGEVVVDHASAQRLCRRGSTFRYDDDAHLPEHCLEVELPFLQRVMPRVRMVPGLSGRALDPSALAADLTPLMAAQEDRILIVSSDLSHYHTYQQANELDRGLLQAIEAGDMARVASGEACGLQLVLTLMHLSSALNWRAQTLHYCNSGDTCGSKHEVVGYGAVIFTA